MSENKKEKNLSPDQAISIMLKCALDYNSGVIAYASLLVNKKDLSEKGFKMAFKEFDKMAEGYEKQLQEIVGSVKY